MHLHGFLSQIDPNGKMNLSACLQCGRCSSGCTMRHETDLLPHQMNRMAILGMGGMLLASRAIWLCVSCQTCVSRCPMKVDTPSMIDALRRMYEAQSGKSRAKQADKDRIRIFNHLLLESVRRYGRVYEFGLMGAFKLRTRDLLSDLNKLPKMLKKGRLRLLPPRRRGGREVEMIFERVSQERRADQ